MNLQIAQSNPKALKFQTVAEAYCQSITNPQTRRAKENDLRLFERFIAESGGVEEAFLADWSREATVAFIEDCAELEVAPATIARRLATLKHFANVLAKSNIGNAFVNPVDSLSVAVPEAAPIPLTDQYISELRRILDDELETFVGARRMALCSLFLEAGLKTDEALQLVVGSVCMKSRTLCCIDKTGRREIPLNGRLHKALSLYLGQRTATLEAHAGYFDLPTAVRNALPLLISEWGAVLSNPETLRLSAKTAFRIVRDLGERIELCCPSPVESLNPSVLRDAFVFRLIRAGATPKQIAHLAGIAPDLVLRYYTAEVNKVRLIELLEALS